MDSSTLTHVAAVVVTVLVTLGLVGTFGSSSDKSVETKSGDDDAAAASGGGGGKKKKKKKSKANSNNNGNNNNNDSKPEEAPEKKVVNADANANNSNGGGAGKKKKKNKGTSGNTNGAAKGTAPAKTEAVPAPAPVAAAKPKPAAPIVVDDGGWQNIPAAAVEEEWSNVGDKKKKKKNKPAMVKTATVNGASVTGAPAPAAASTATDSVTVDAKKVGIIIGPKGATMLAIQEATGCKLDINAPSKDDPKAVKATKAGVVITGPDKESIAAAKKAVLELASKGYATLLQEENFGEYGTEVHPSMLSELVGPRGATIQAIQKTLQVKITIPSTDWAPNNRKGVFPNAFVGIAGTKDNAKAAKAVIQSLVKYHHHEMTHPGMIHDEVYVPSEYFHCVIGVRGSEIKHIRGNYKVDMYMPNDDSITENVLVVGMRANVDKAMSYIQLLMDRDAASRDAKYTDENY